jgi:tyrosine decarboxylase/aspartate 1-decarboxylase
MSRVIPQTLPSDLFLRLLESPFARLSEEFASLPSADDSSLNSTAATAVLDEVATRLADNYPYFHPLYAGQMLKPPTPSPRPPTPWP